MKFPSLFLIMMGLSSLTNGFADSLPSLKDFDGKLARQLVEKHGALLIDVRTDSEFAANGIKGAQHLPLSDLERRASEIKKWAGGNLERPIVVYCETGGRSSRARGILKRLGFSNVVNLGSWRAW